MEGSLAPETAHRPEEALLLACARLRLSPNAAGRVWELARQVLDWPYLLKLAEAHGLTPLLSLHLKAAAADLVPPDRLAALEAQNLGNSAWNLLLTAELVRLLGLLKAAGVQALPFKGPTLAALAYGDLSLRQFGDLDLLIRRADFHRAGEVLLAQGYRPELQLTASQLQALLRSYYHLGFFESERGVLAELHWELSKWWGSLALAEPGWWERAEPVSLGGERVLSLSPEDLLVLLCVHGGLHTWFRLGWVLDVAALLEIPRGLRWERVSSLGRETGSGRMLRVGLGLARYLTEAPISSEMEAEMRADSAAEALAGQAFQGLFDAGRRPSEFRFHLGLRQGWRQKLGFARRSIFTPTDEDVALVSLPAPLSFLYSCLRPWRLAGKHLFKLKALQK